MARRLVAEPESGQRQADQEHRRDGKNRVERQGGAELGNFLFRERRHRVPEQFQHRFDSRKMVMMFDGRFHGGIMGGALVSGETPPGKTGNDPLVSVFPAGGFVGDSWLFDWSEPGAFRSE